ncbi:MAG: TSUP family transporter [Vicinamibacterales bacterium]
MTLICVAAFVASALTFVSGFGLGTLLTPVFAIFFPLQIAIAATAVVHLANNLFKLVLTGRSADWRIAARFGVPATIGALVGAGALVASSGLPALAQYEWAGEIRRVTFVKVIVGALIVAFALLESNRRFRSVQVPVRYLQWGGALAGFFGGLSGIQGALRSAFLIKAGLEKDAYVATGVVCAVLVDVARLVVYGGSQMLTLVDTASSDIAAAAMAAVVCAFAGALVGARLLKDLTLRSVRVAVSIMLVGFGLALATGLL